MSYISVFTCGIVQRKRWWDTFVNCATVLMKYSIIIVAGLFCSWSILHHFFAFFAQPPLQHITVGPSFCSPCVSSCQRSAAASAAPTVRKQSSLFLGLGTSVFPRRRDGADDALVVLRAVQQRRQEYKYNLLRAGRDVTWLSRGILVRISPTFSANLYGRSPLFSLDWAHRFFPGDATAPTTL